MACDFDVSRDCSIVLKPLNSWSIKSRLSFMNCLVLGSKSSNGAEERAKSRVKSSKIEMSLQSSGVLKILLVVWDSFSISIPFVNPT